MQALAIETLKNNDPALFESFSWVCELNILQKLWERPT